MTPPSDLIENDLRANGYKLIAGVDEAGRGPLAGPVVAAVVVLPPGLKISGLDDSKKLSALKRELLFKIIKTKACAIGVGKVGHKQIDKLNIYQATRLAMKKAVENLSPRPDYLLVDGKRMIIDLDISQQSIIGGDGKSCSIAAASIIAKVTRDRLMERYHTKYSQYGFAAHKGYGTRQHRLNLKRHGPCAIHRRSFALVS
ncbi:MAG: ribonuclease HII [bacterium]